MRIGTLSPNTKTWRKKNGEPVTSTYYVLTNKDGNQKTVSESVPVGRLEEYQELSGNYLLFRQLSREYEELADSKARLLMAGADAEKRAKKTADRPGKEVGAGGVHAHGRDDAPANGGAGHELP